MDFTLKLSHIAWPTPEGPHTWMFGKNPPAGNRARAGLVDSTREELEAEVGAGFEGSLLEDPSNGWVYYDPDADGPYRWRLHDTTSKFLREIGLDNVRFESNPAHDIEAWIAGVRQVKTFGDVLPNSKALLDVANGVDPRFKYLCSGGNNIETWTWMGPEKKTIRKVIMVSFADRTTRTMLVERAWLLGSNGDTIEKICP